MIGPVYTGGVEVVELDVEHVVAQPLPDGDLARRCQALSARIRELLAESQALRGQVAA